MKRLAVVFPLIFLLAAARSSAQETGLESMTGKTVLVMSVVRCQLVVATDYGPRTTDVIREVLSCREKAMLGPCWF